MQMKLNDGRIVEGSPEEIAQYEKLSRQPAEFVQARPKPAPVAVNPFGSLLKNHTESAITSMEKVVDDVHSGSKTIKQSIMERMHRAIGGTDYELFRKMWAIKYPHENTPVLRRSRKSASGDSKYMKTMEQVVDMYVAGKGTMKECLESFFDRSIGGNDYSMFKQVLASRHPKTKVSQYRNFNGDNSRKGIIKTESNFRKKLDELVKFLVEHDITITGASKRIIGRALVPKEVEIVQSEIRKKYPRDAEKIIEARKHGRRMGKGRHAIRVEPTTKQKRKYHFKPEFLEQKRNYLLKVTAERKRLQAQGIAWNDALSQAHKNVRAQAQPQAPALMTAPAPSPVTAPAPEPVVQSFPPIYPIDVEDTHRLEEQVKVILTNNFPFKQHNVSALKLVFGLRWSEDIWQKFIESFLLRSNEISQYFGIANRFVVEDFQGEKVIRYQGDFRAREVGSI